MDDEKLFPLAKLLYSLLSGFADENGECYPSDAYLSKRLGLELRQTKSMVAMLEDNGYIERVTSRNPNNPFRTSRIIKVITNFKKYLPSAVHCPPENAVQRPNGGQCDAPIVSEIRLVSEEKTLSPPSPKTHDLVHRWKPEEIESFSLFGKFVKISDEFYKTIIVKEGSNFIHDIIDQMNDYVEAHNKPYKDYEAAIRIWVKKRRDAEKSTNKASSSSVEDDKKLVEAIRLKMKDVRRPPHLKSLGLLLDATSAVAIHFPTIKGGYYKFGEKGFRDKVLSALRKLELPTDGL